MFSFAERDLPLPSWLANIQVNHLPNQLPLAEMLDGSFFYPASGQDGSIVALASGYSHSFGYVDYATDRKQLLAALIDSMGPPHLSQ